MAKKKVYLKKKFESTGVPSDTSANIYESMLLSPAWKSLTSNQQVLYLTCKAQYYAEKTTHKPAQYPDGNEALFTMNRAKWRDKYELYTGNNSAGFYRDMKALIEKGFIACIESGRNTRTKSIYLLSHRWRDYGTDRFKVPLREMTPSMAMERRMEKLPPSSE